MNAQSLFCPNSACPATGQVAEAKLSIHDRRRGRYRCTVCRRTFTARTGTPLAAKQTAPEIINRVVALVSHGCPITAIEAAFDLDRRTVRRWVTEAGNHAERIHQHHVLQPRDIQHVQADEVRVKLQGTIVWMAMAVVATTHLWLGGSVSRQRNLALITALLTLIQRSTVVIKRLLLVTDGLRHYRTAAQRVFRQPQRRGQRGRPRLRRWPGLVLVQVVKMSQRNVWRPWSRTLIRQGKRIAWVLRRTPRSQVVSTAGIERLNATFRERCAPLARRTRHLARHVATIQTQMYLVGTVYNFCTVHRSLQVTPAMAAGITDHHWSVGDLLAYRIPPPRWQPPRRRGRPSKATQALEKRWCR